MASDATPPGRDQPAAGTPVPPTPSYSLDLGLYVRPGRENVILIYALYLAGLIPALGVVPIIIGFVMALLNRSEATGVWKGHYEFQFRTAAIGLLFVVVSGILTVVLIGFIGLLLTAIWWIVRCVKGIQSASHDKPIADPAGWGW